MTDGFECPICSDYFKDLVETPCCHGCFCRSCLASWLQNKPTCPSCRSSISIDRCLSNIPLQRMVNSSPTECPYSDLGCSDKLTIGIVAEHVLRCPHAPIECPNSTECGTISRLLLPKHLSEECKYRNTPCSQCLEQIPLHNLEDHVANLCPNTNIHCLNKCGKIILRGKMEEHYQECELMEIPCPFMAYGCKFKTLRNNMEIHVQNSNQEHIKNLMSTIEEKDERLNHMQTELLNERQLSNVLSLEKVALEESIRPIVELLPNLKYSPMYGQPVLLPDALSERYHSDAIIVKQDIVEYTSTGVGSLFNKLKKQVIDKEIIVPANRIIPCTYAHKSTYYFEIKILFATDPCLVAIGLVPVSSHLYGMPGWYPGTYGYHGDDGKAFNINTTGPSGKAFGPTWGKDSIVGCGYDQDSEEIFFTLNGVYLGVAFQKVPPQEYYPCIGMKYGGTRVQVNLGKEPFVYLLPPVASNSRAQKRQKLSHAIAQGKCTFSVTQRRHVPQFFYQCGDCELNGTKGCCISCATVCHRGHKLTLRQYSPLFYCDCGGDANFPGRKHVCLANNL
eukprot:TRINITY_DN8101_c0_g1_i1.p1 TRINITY_DN8101_c0_g1~~TRINITY_DN8101_c0_g1_i1.p1  ORF type:complete len:562 (-),score=63.47 TRINITY_DN8101_c0_g1_i1:29-1714(-)